MLHCDLRVRWKVASDLRFRAAISEPKAPSFCGISGDLALSTQKSLAIAIVRFWCAKLRQDKSAQRLTFWARRLPGGVGVLPREGVGVEKLVPSLESLFSFGFERGNLGCPGNFAGTSRTPGNVQKLQRKFVHNVCSPRNKSPTFFEGSCLQ